MQKVRSFLFIIELLIRLLFQLDFPHGTAHLAIAYISYLVLEEGSPFIQTDMHSNLLI